MAHATALRPSLPEQGTALGDLRIVTPPASDGFCKTEALDEATTPELTLGRLAARAAAGAAGVASVAGVAEVIPAGARFDLRVSVRAYLGDFLEMGWAVRSAICDAAAEAGFGRLLGLIDVQVVELVQPARVLPRG